MPPLCQLGQGILARAIAFEKVVGKGFLRARPCEVSEANRGNLAEGK